MQSPAGIQLRGPIPTSSLSVNDLRPSGTPYAGGTTYPNPNTQNSGISNLYMGIPTSQPVQLQQQQQQQSSWNNQQPGK
jgi:hypothetical protein